MPLIRNYCTSCRATTRKYRQNSEAIFWLSTAALAWRIRPRPTPTSRPGWSKNSINCGPCTWIWHGAAARAAPKCPPEWEPLLADERINLEFEAREAIPLVAAGDCAGGDFLGLRPRAR